MKKFPFLPLLILVSVIILATSGCVYENEDELFGEVCDSTNVTYTDLWPILEANCLVCHGPEQSYRGMRVDQYEVIKEFAESGRLYRAVNHIGDGPKMPKDADKLDPCTLAKINNWIKNDTPE